MVGAQPRTGWVAVLILALLGCSSAVKPNQPTGPLPLEDEVREAAKVAAEQPSLVVRFNPARCTCPPFELQLGARWLRLAIEGAEAVDPASPEAAEPPDGPGARLLARAKQDLEAGELKHYRVVGDLSSSPNKCARGALYLSLALSDDPADPAEAAE